METDEITLEGLSDLAFAIIEGYWILCEPAEVVGRAIEEFVSYANSGQPYLFGEKPVSADELLSALNEVIAYFMFRQMWPTEESFRPIIEEA